MHQIRQNKMQRRIDRLMMQVRQYFRDNKENCSTDFVMLEKKINKILVQKAKLSDGLRTNFSVISARSNYSLVSSLKSSINGLRMKKEPLTPQT